MCELFLNILLSLFWKPKMDNLVQWSLVYIARVHCTYNCTLQKDILQRYYCTSTELWQMTTTGKFAQFGFYFSQKKRLFHSNPCFPFCIVVNCSSWIFYLTDILFTSRVRPIKLCKCTLKNYVYITIDQTQTFQIRHKIYAFENCHTSFHWKILTNYMS